MTFRDLHFVVTVLFASALAAACSSSPKPAQAYVSASAVGSATCTAPGSLVIIGSGTNPSSPTRIANGSGASVTCSVSGNKGSFELQLEAENGTGSLTVTGSVMPDAGMATQVAASINSTNIGTFQESDCMITLNPDVQNGPIQPGRVWGSIECPTATLQGKISGSGNPITCDVSADFIFENCSD